jgi:hypothetical protein
MSQENNFYLSDSENDETSDDDSDFNLNLDLYNDENISTLDNLDLKYYPEPYNTMAQFILSSVVGSYMVYLNHPNKDVDDMLKLKLVDNYFKYCQNVDTDEYLNGLFNELNLSDENKIVILDRCKDLVYELINNIKYNNINNDNLESINIKVIQEAISIIKFSDVYGLVKYNKN